LLYVASLTTGVSLTRVPPDPGLRITLERMDLDSLRARLLELDPDPGVDLRNPVRMVRAVEVLEVAGAPLRRLRGRTAPPWRAIHIGVTAPLAMIDARIEKRSREQVERGLIAETQAALDAGVPVTAPVLTGIGYAEALAHIRGEVPLGEL